jgi:hypothetical protein
MKSLRAKSHNSIHLTGRIRKLRIAPPPANSKEIGGWWVGEVSAFILDLR